MGLSGGSVACESNRRDWILQRHSKPSVSVCELLPPAPLEKSLPAFRTRLSPRRNVHAHTHSLATQPRPHALSPKPHHGAPRKRACKPGNAIHVIHADSARRSFLYHQGPV